MEPGPSAYDAALGSSADALARDARREEHRLPALAVETGHVRHDRADHGVGLIAKLPRTPVVEEAPVVETPTTEGETEETPGM